MAEDTSRSATSGYELNIFKGKVDSKFLCQECKHVLRDPQQTYCGHRFCSVCLTELFESDEQKVCPTCSQENEPDCVLKKEESFPDRAITREIAKLDSICVHEGCEWADNFINYDRHAADCDFIPVRCACDETFPKLNFEDHQINHCRLRSTECQHCSDQILVVEVDTHERTCPKVPTKCDCCGAMVARDILPNHQHPEHGDCTHIICPYGCQQIVLRSLLTEHNTQHQDKHFKYVLNEVENLREKSVADEQKVMQLESRVDTCISKLENTQIPTRRESDSSSNGSNSPTSSRMKRVENKLKALEKAVELNQNVVAVLSNETARNSDSLTHQQCDESMHAMQDRLTTLERDLLLKNLRLQQQEQQMREMEARSYDGTLIWRIPEFSKKLEDAKNGRVTSIISPPFHTSPYGYKMCVKMYPNGDGSGRGTHISMYFVMLKGDYDPILTWPFTANMVVYQLIDQGNERKKEHHLDAFRPDPNSSSFQCPTNSMNPGFGCPEFVSHPKLTDRRRTYIKNDTVFLKVFIKERRNETS